MQEDPTCDSGTRGLFCAAHAVDREGGGGVGPPDSGLDVLVRK